MNDFAFSLNPPKDEYSFLNSDSLKQAILLSRKSPRKRIIVPLHKSADDKLHRMFNIIQPGSYVRPHNHLKAFKSESIILLKGAICAIIYDENGKIIEYKNLKANSNYFGIDFDPHVYHSFFAIEEDTVVFEVKPGPYKQQIDKDFVTWAPEEFTPEAEIFLKQIMHKTGHI